STPVRNEYSYQYGPVSLLKATADSINTAFVDLTTKMSGGPDKILSTAQAAGVPKGAGWTANSRVPLGTAEVSPLNQASGYATFANDGTSVAPHVVKEVRDPRGRLIYRANPEQHRAVSQDISHDVTYALENVVEQGTGRTVQTLNVPVAGKTGTKDVGDNIVSAWFVAYTKQISTAVMYVAGDGGNDDLDKYRRPGDSTFFGGTYPALTWADYMGTAVDGLPVKQFDPPAWVNQDATAQSTLPAPSQPSATRAAPSATTTRSKPSASRTASSSTPSPRSTPSASRSASGRSNGSPSPSPKTGGSQAGQNQTGVGAATGPPGTTNGTG
ncbi:MAG: penicillin-binding transpeptidase domain-containing protein, partial [Catenulispora sp.]